MKKILKKPLSIIVAVIVCCYTTVFAFASSNVSDDIIGYYTGVENPQATLHISGISGADDEEIFVSAYYSTVAGGFIVGFGHNSYVKANSCSFTLPKVKWCEKNGTNPHGEFRNCVLICDIIRESSFFNTTLYLSEGGYKYRKL